MIRINLLPVRKTQQKQTVQQQLLGAAAAVIVTLIACMAWTLTMKDTADEKQKEVAKKNEDIAQLDKIIGEVNEFTAKKTELEEKLKVIEDLKRGKTGPVRALDDLASEIPNSVWITKMAEQGQTLTIEGKALEHEDVSAFMKVLQKSKYFSGIVLGHSKSDAKAGGVTFYDFRITCRVDYSA